MYRPADMRLSSLGRPLPRSPATRKLPAANDALPTLSAVHVGYRKMGSADQQSASPLLGHPRECGIEVVFGIRGENDQYQREMAWGVEADRSERHARCSVA